MINSTPNIPVGKWIKCDACGEILYKEHIQQNLSVCTNCGNHFRLSARRRISQIVDEGTFEEFDADMVSENLLNYPDYEKKLEALAEKTKMKEAVKTGRGKVKGNDVVIAVMDGNFLMGSMGAVVGEKITRAIEYATRNRLPLCIFTVSGGARMQEGIISLMQMAKTSAAIAKHNEAGLFYLTVLTDPTSGGVSASFAMLGDVIISEPNCLICFAGPRVIEQTINAKLPEGFQRAEFLLEHGFIDMIVERKDLKNTIAKLLKIHSCNGIKCENENQITIQDLREGEII